MFYRHFMGFIFIACIISFGYCIATSENNETISSTTVASTTATSTLPSTASSTTSSTNTPLPTTSSTSMETNLTTSSAEPEIKSTTSNNISKKNIVVHGLRVIKRAERNPYILRIKDSHFHLIGTFLNNIKEAWLSTLGHCTDKDTAKINVKLEPQFVAIDENAFTRNASVSLPESDDPESQIYHFCGKMSDGSFISHSCKEEDASWRPFIKLAKEENSSKIFLPIYIQIPVIMLLAFLSALFSGLNVGLMSLSVSSLELIIKHDQAKKQYAQNILPLRRNGNLLLCTILIGNTFVNNAMTLLVSNLLDETMEFEKWLNFMLSVVLPAAIIVFIGEIIPQAICCRYGLIIGSRTRYITIFFIVLTFIVSYPLSKILDWLIGVEGPESYDNATLEHIIDMNVEQVGGFTRHLADIARRALQFFNGKRAYDVMTPIERVYMLSETAVINNELVKKISENGYTRIPIHKDGDDNNIIGILNVKDLVPIDRKCDLTIGTIIQIWQRSKHFRFVNEDFYISQLLKEMKRGQSMALVIRFSDETKSYKVIGIIALEDIIEELTGEILDEKDVKRLKKQKNLR